MLEIHKYLVITQHTLKQPMAQEVIKKILTDVCNFKQLTKHRVS